MQTPRRAPLALAWLVALALLAPRAADAGEPPTPRHGPSKVAPAHKLHGVASYYAKRFDGRRTASGETFDNDKLTAAHRTLPLGTQVRVTDVATGKAVTVEVNDRGPHVAGRTIDLSRRAGEELGLTKRGTAQVTIEVVSPPAG